MKLNISIRNGFDCPVHNENGSAIVIAMIVLILLTFIGMSAINTTQTELKIAGNERVYKQNFNLAEAAIQDAAQRLLSTPHEDRLSTLQWVHLIPLNESFSMEDITNWNAGNTMNISPTLTVAAGIIKAEGEGMESSLYRYTILARSQSNNGDVLLQVGFKTSN